MFGTNDMLAGEDGVRGFRYRLDQIVQRSLVDFQKDTRGTGARVVPWLQDFTLGVTYGPKQVCDQVKAAKADGVDEWLLYDMTSPSASHARGFAMGRLFQDGQAVASCAQEGLIRVLS